MQDFVDLPGASGAAYRFRTAQGRAQPPMAGNYAWVRFEGAEISVVELGAADDLSRVTHKPPPRAAEDAQLFTRLNVVRAVREAEHQDLIEQHRGSQGG